MAVYNIRSITLKGISLFVAIAFTATTLTGSPSLALASAVSVMPDSPAASGLARDLYAMPAEWGSLVSFFPGTRDSGLGTRLGSSSIESRGASDESRFVIMLQDAHSNPEGQAHIAAMLRYLDSKAPGLVIGLEGASGELHPEYLEFFKDYPEADRAVVKALGEQGELNGVERFLLEKRQKGLGTRDLSLVKASPAFQSESRGTSPEFRVSGIEDAELYRENIRTYRELLSRREDMQKLLAPARVALEKEASKTLRAGLRDFLKERSRRKEGKFDLEASLGAQSDADLAAYIRYLRPLVLKQLEIDLNDPIEQLRFPNLMRIVRLEKTRSGYEPAAVRSQWEAVIRDLKAAAKAAEEKAFVSELIAFANEKKFIESGDALPMTPAVERDLYPRAMVEKLFRFAQAHELSFSEREAFWQSWKLVVFQAEVDIAELIEEIERLEGLLLETLAVSDVEKTLVQKLGDLDLLEKMLRLELSRREYARAMAGRERLNAFVSASKPLAVALQKAYGFYEVSLQRDEALVSNLLAGAERRADGENLDAKRSTLNLYVLYSGGFHTPGIEEILRQQGVGYAVFSPRISKVDHGEMYQRAMDGSNADLSAYFKVKNPFLTKQEALLFKQLIETAAPVLSKTYKLSPDQVALQVSQAVKDHPVLSGVVLADPGSETESASVRFQSKPDLQTLIPQNSSAIPEAILESAQAARANAGLSRHEPVAGVVDFASGAVSPSAGIRSEAREVKPVAEMSAEAFARVVQGLQVNNPLHVEVIRAMTYDLLHMTGASIFFDPEAAVSGIVSMLAPSIDPAAFHFRWQDPKISLQWADWTFLSGLVSNILMPRTPEGQWTSNDEYLFDRVKWLFSFSQSGPLNFPEAVQVLQKIFAPRFLSTKDGLRVAAEAREANGRAFLDLVRAFELPVDPAFDQDAETELIRVGMTNYFRELLEAHRADYTPDAVQHARDMLDRVDQATGHLRSEARIPQVEFFHPSRKTARLAYVFMREALRKKAVDPMTGKRVDLEGIAKDVNDLNRALLSLSGDQLKGLLRNIIADMKPLMIPGEEKDHDLTELKWQMTQKAHELIVGHYGINHPGGFGKATDPILMLSEIIAEMYLKKRLGHELPEKYAAFQRPAPAEALAAAQKPSAKDKPPLEELAARIRAAAASRPRSEMPLDQVDPRTSQPAAKESRRSEMREIPGVLTRQEGFSGELVVPGIRVADEYFFEFDSRKKIDAQARFSHILKALKASLRVHLREELLPVSEALVDIFDPVNYSGSKAQKKAFAAKITGLKANLQTTLDPASYKHIAYLIDEQLEFQGKQDGSRNPVGPFVKFYKSVIRAMLPSGAPEDAQRKDLYTEADITLRQFRVLIYSQFRCATDPDKQLDMLEAALDKQIAQAESMAQSDDMSIMTQGMMLRSRLKAVKRRFLGVNREGIKKLLTPSSSIITILYSKMLASDMVSPEEFQRLDKLTLEKTGKPLGGKAKEHFMYERGLYQRQRFIEEQIRREGIEICKRKYPHYYTIPDLVDSLENVIAEVAEQGTVEYDPGKSRRVVVKIDQAIGVGQFREIMKMYPGMVGVITDSITANSHPSAISPVPILIVDPSDQNFHEIKKGDTVAVEPTFDGRTIAKVDADQAESARIEAENEKRVLLEKAFRTLVPLDSRNKHLANTVVGEDLDAFWDILEGIGLNRTEVDEKVEKEMVEMIRSYNKMPQEARSYQKLSRKLLDIMVQGYYAQVHNPKLKGRTNKFRTIDVQRDKNENLFVYYKGGTGIEFYETDLGREVLTTQVAALLMILGNEALEQKSSASRIQVMFPQVRNRKDAIFFRDMILPEAIKRAQLELKRSRGRLRSLGDADGTLNGKIHPPLNDEVVAAAVEQALDAVSFESMAETMSLFEPAADGETGNLELDEILKLEYRGKPFIQGISVGMNDTEFSIVRDLVEKRSANQPITGLTQGESEILDEIVKKLQGRNLADLTRDEAVLQPFFGKLTPIFVRYYEAIAQAAARAGISLSFCGETAGKDEFELFAQYLTRTHKISLSKSMGPRKIGRLRLQSHRIERDLDQRTEMPEWFQKFSRGEDASEAMNRYLSNAFVEDPALQSFLLDLAKVQEEFVAEGYFDGLFRPDFNPLNQAGGYGIFKILKSQLARQKPLIELSEGPEVVLRDLMAILEYMKERALISEGQAKTITEAYLLFQVIAEVFENLKRQGSSLVYEDGLNPETIGTFYQKVAEVYAQRIRQPLPWGAGAPEETVAAYSSMLFGLVTDTLRDEYMERIPPMQQTQVIQDLEQAGGVGTTGQEELLEMVMDERSDITLYLETLTGFRYSREKYMRIRPKAHPDQDFVERIVYHFRYVPEDMIRILLVAAEKGARIDLRVQRAMSIIAHEKSRNPDPAWTQRLNERGWPLLRQILLLPQNVHYSEIQLTRFNLLQFLLAKEDLPSSSRILSVRRSMTLLEILSKDDPFQVRAYHVLKSLGAAPQDLYTLRLALYPNLLKSMSKVDPDGNAERFRVLQLQNTVSALLRQDLLNPPEIEKAVEGILAGAEAAQLSPEERLVFFKQVYLMALVQRMASFDPVDRKLLLQEGIYSPFAAIEQVYEALIESLALPDSFSIPEAVRHASEMVAGAKTWQKGSLGWQVVAIYPRSLFDDFRQGIATGGVWRSVLEDYLVHTQEGELSGLRNYLEEVIKDNGRLNEYFGYFTQESSEYYLRGLGPKELLRQLFHYIHLDYLRNMDLADGNAEVVATVRPVFFRKITSAVHHTYEIGFGDVIDHPGILGLYLKVLGRNGFQIAGVEPATVEFPEIPLAPGEKKKTVAQKQSRGFVVRVLGYFPHSVNPEDRIQTIQQDLKRLIKLPRKTSGSIVAQTKAATENAWRSALAKGKGYGPTVSMKIPGRQTGNEPDSVSFVRNAAQGLQLLIETRQERTNFYEALIGMIHLKFPGVSVAAIHRNLRGTVNRVVISFEGEIISSDQRKLLELITGYLKSDKASIGHEIRFTARSESRAKIRIGNLLKTGAGSGMVGVVAEDVRKSFSVFFRSESRGEREKRLNENWEKVVPDQERTWNRASVKFYLKPEARDRAGITVKAGNVQWDYLIGFSHNKIVDKEMFSIDRWSVDPVSGSRIFVPSGMDRFGGAEALIVQGPGAQAYSGVMIGKDEQGIFVAVGDLQSPGGTTVLWDRAVWEIAPEVAREESVSSERESGGSSGLPQILGSPDFNEKFHEQVESGSSVRSSGLPQILGSPDAFRPVVAGKTSSFGAEMTGSGAGSVADHSPFLVEGSRVALNPRYDLSRYTAMKTVGPTLAKAINQVLAEWPDREESGRLLELLATSAGSGILGEPTLVDLLVTFFGKKDVRDFLKGYFRFILRISQASPKERSELLAGEQAARYALFAMPAFLKARPHSNMAFLRPADPRFMVWQGTPEAAMAHAMVLEQLYHFTQDEDEYIAVFAKWEGREFLFYRPSYRPLWQVADLVAVRGSRYEPLQAVPVPLSILPAEFSMRLSSLVAERITAPSRAQNEGFQRDSDAKGFSDFSYTRELENIRAAADEDQLLEIVGNLGPVRPILVRMRKVHFLKRSPNPRIQQAIDEKLAGFREAPSARSETRSSVDKKGVRAAVEEVSLGLEQAYKVNEIQWVPEDVAVRVADVVSYFRDRGVIRSAMCGGISLDAPDAFKGLDFWPGKDVKITVVPADGDPDRVKAGLREFWMNMDHVAFLAMKGKKPEWHKLFIPVGRKPIPWTGETIAQSRDYDVTGIWGIHIRPSQEMRRWVELFAPIIVSANIQNLTNFPGRNHSLFDDREIRIAEMYSGNRVRFDIVFKKDVPHIEREIKNFWTALESLQDPEGDKPENRQLFTAVRSESRKEEPVEVQGRLERTYEIQGAFGLYPVPVNKLALFASRLSPHRVYLEYNHEKKRLDEALEILSFEARSGRVVITIEPSTKLTLEDRVVDLFWKSIESLMVQDAQPGVLLLKPVAIEMPVALTRTPELPRAVNYFEEAPTPIEEAIELLSGLEFSDRSFRERSPDWGNATPEIVAKAATIHELLLHKVGRVPSPRVAMVLTMLELDDQDAQIALGEVIERFKAAIMAYDVERLDQGIRTMDLGSVTYEGNILKGRTTMEGIEVELAVDLTNANRETVGISTRSSISASEQVEGVKKLSQSFSDIAYQRLKAAAESVRAAFERSARGEVRPSRDAEFGTDLGIELEGSTRELKEGVQKVFADPRRSEMRKIVERWGEALEKKGTPGAAAIMAAAKQLGLYSQKSLTFEMKDPRKARLWIALKVLEEMEASEARIENRQLQDVITKVLASARDLGTVADLGKAGPEFHVNMSRMNEAGVFENPSEKDWDELARNFPVVIALLISLHGRLSINVNVPETELAAVRQKFAAMLDKEGIQMDPELFRFVSASAKVPFESFKSGKASLFARDLEAVKTYNRNVTRWFSNDRGNMASFAAGLATALLRSAGDENLDRHKVHEPSEFDRVLAAVVNAFAGYASIRKSA